MFSRLLRPFTGPRLPAGVTLPLGAQERLTAVGSLVDGATIATTNRGLWLAGADAALTWDRIHMVRWQRPTLRITPGAHVGDLEDGLDDELGEGIEVVADQPDLRLELDNSADLAEEIRVRVVASVVYAVHHSPPGVFVVARRVPGRDGLRWAVRFDADCDTPTNRRTAAELVLLARAGV